MHFTGPNTRSHFFPGFIKYYAFSECKFNGCCYCVKREKATRISASGNETSATALAHYETALRHVNLAFPAPAK